ncbi:Man(5)GlcNAc(2)-PP-Dol alpha-1,3-mannosyltransferase [Gossypium arboreum]|uniref:Man(5)GlcNAc(2)-PP-Dol alpha-1,3-mannosyltransferase n=1 Tax=Gossypium arboreum TaxID=29729 RepID=A0A0B0MUW5_GOSAR|nr:Man(5)GlcNAc(2)-PP-Dol alpha-1,3-mannosyltransferase [Gossypium arboreum]
MVLHAISYRCHYPRQGLTRIKYDVNVPDMVLHVTTYIDANVPDMDLHENTYRILCHDICILAIPKVRRGFLDVVTQSNEFVNIIPYQIHIRLTTYTLHIIHFIIISSYLFNINNIYLHINLPRTMKIGTGWLIDNFSFPPIQIQFLWFLI